MISNSYVKLPESIWETKMRGGALNLKCVLCVNIHVNLSLGILIGRNFNFFGRNNIDNENMLQFELPRKSSDSVLIYP